MQIHVVQRGQSLFRIAHAYGTTAEAIIRVNVIPEPNRLVVGQALVIPIPGSFYWVQPGDTLYDIAKRLGVRYLAIAQANRMETNRQLRAGTRLTIPPQPKRKAVIGSYAELYGTDADGDLAEAVREAAPELSYLAPWSYRIQIDGTLFAPPVHCLRSLAVENNADLIMVVTNLENGRYSEELGRIVLHDMRIQNTLLDNIAETVEQYGFHGVHFDMECFHGDEREAYHRFLRRAGDRLHAGGRTISSSLSPKTCAARQGSRLEGLDYGSHTDIVDFIVIKSSEWKSPGAETMPVSSFGTFRRVLRYAVNEIPASNIMIEQNLSGYDWTQPDEPGGSGVRLLSPQEAVELAMRESVFIRYDYGLQAPHFDYIDEAGKHHQVWFEDARSVRARLNLVKELGLRGVVFRKLGLPFPQLRHLIGEYFQVGKRD